jgi:hypothetical protein
MADVTGSGSIGTNYPAIANRAIAGETTAGALGFGAPTFGAAGTVYDYEGTASVTTAASSLAATATQEISGSASLTTAAAILVGAGDEIVAGYGDLDTAASSLDISGVLAYNGSVALESASASLTATGTIGDVVYGTGAWTSAPAILAARGKLRRATLQGGHDLVDLAGYNKFVGHGAQILEELGQPPAETGATDPVVDPVPTLEIRPADYRQFLAAALERARQQTTSLSVPSLRVTGKAWVKGQAVQTTPAAWLTGTGTHQFAFQLEAAGAPAKLVATGAVDNYYTIRRQDDALIEQFILEQLYGATAA